MVQYFRCLELWSHQNMCFISILPQSASFLDQPKASQAKFFGALAQNKSPQPKNPLGACNRLCPLGSLGKIPDRHSSRSTLIPFRDQVFPELIPTNLWRHLVFFKVREGSKTLLWKERWLYLPVQSLNFLRIPWAHKGRNPGSRCRQPTHNFSKPEWPQET